MDVLKSIISVDDEILSGHPVLKETRVPIQTLFFPIENGIFVDEFLEDFPSGTKEQAWTFSEPKSAL